MSDTQSSADEYAALVPTLESLRQQLVATLTSACGVGGVRLAMPIESRVKTWDSLRGKLERGVAGIRDFREYNDLIGARVVVPLTTDLLLAQRAIRSACRIERTYSTKDRLGADQFGYVASHYVVALSAQDSNRVFRAEVQLVTEAQHIWAYSSHELQYKSVDATPPELRRSVHRIAALLELVDLEFERLIESRDTYRRSVQLDDDATLLDVDVLDMALPKLWPPEHPFDRSINGMVLSALHEHNIRTMGDLRRLVSTQRSAVFADNLEHIKRLLEAVDKGTRQGNTYTLTTVNGSRSYHNVRPDMIERARRGVFYSLSGLTFTALQFASGEREPPPGTGVAFPREAG